jgi:hypothetical protein
MKPDELQVPETVDVSKPSAARMYDYFLGGYSNFEADRVAAEQVLQIAPIVRDVAVANRSYLQRAVTFMIDQGIKQFLDIGSGLPTVGNVHETVQRTAPDSRVVYVDIDPVVVEHAKGLLQDNPQAMVVQADARRPEQVLQNREVRHLLDFEQPLGILLVSVLHFLPNDETAYEAVLKLHDAAVAGSFLALSHVTNENVPEEVVNQITAVYGRSAQPGAVRSQLQIAHFFEGWELVEPGLVWLPLWKPIGQYDSIFEQPEESMMLAGLGRKPWQGESYVSQ